MKITLLLYFTKTIHLNYSTASTYACVVFFLWVSLWTSCIHGSVSDTANLNSSHISVLNSQCSRDYTLHSAVLHTKCLTVRQYHKDKTEMREITSFTKILEPENRLNPPSVSHQLWREETALELPHLFPSHYFPCCSFGSGRHPISVLD